MIHVSCRRKDYCYKSEHSNWQACAVCTHNKNSTAIPKIDNFEPKISGIKFL